MTRNDSLKSEEVIISAPLSFAGSAQRIWRISKAENPVLRVVLIIVSVLLVLAVWSFIAAWYLVFGIFLIPYRLLRRSSRKQKRDNLRHRELLNDQ